MRHLFVIAMMLVATWAYADVNVACQGDSPACTKTLFCQVRLEDGRCLTSPENFSLTADVVSEKKLEAEVAKLQDQILAQAEQLKQLRADLQQNNAVLADANRALATRIKVLEGILANAKSGK